MTTKKTLRTCPNGHRYYKSSDCPTCPLCEQDRKPANSFLSQLSAPARRALENNGITTLQALSEHTESEILHLHGMGPASLPKLRACLQVNGLAFKNKTTFMEPVKDIDTYISTFPEEVRDVLQQLRATIKNAAPQAAETIQYAIPTFTLNGRNLVHFAAYKNHIGFYPAPSGIEAFKNELAAYKGAKGSVQFPLGTPLPYALITRIVTFRAAENSKMKPRR
jgi:uncharacterized protein YdhG (YjbR/CyaY superfamily)